MQFTNIFIFLILTFSGIVVFNSSFNEKVTSKVFNFFELIFSTFWTAVRWWNGFSKSLDKTKSSLPFCQFMWTTNFQ